MSLVRTTTATLLIMSLTPPVGAGSTPKQKAPPLAHAERAPVLKQSASVIPEDLAEKIVGVVSPCGLFLAGSKRRAHVLTLLPGKRVELVPPNQPKYWIVDDVLVEAAFSSEAEMRLPGGRFRDLDLLRQHRRWETDWTAKQNGWGKLDPQEVRVGGPSEQYRSFSIWTYVVPKSLTVLGQSIAQISYLTVAVDDGVVFALSVPLRQIDDPDRAHRLLQKAVDGLEQHRTGDDLAKTANLISQAATRTSTCSDFLSSMSRQLDRP